MKQQYAGSDFVGGNATAKGAIETLFRPSDIAVGPDGALYVSDWIDARVGGHQDLDETLSGAIYRIAPKGFVPKVPAFDAATIDGLITALRSPAVNVRAIGFEGLKARGAAAVNAVAALLNDPNPYMRGRAIYLLYQLGPEGGKRPGRPSRRPIRRCASRPTARCGAPVSTSCRWRRGSRATRIPASAARWRCRCAISPRPRRSTSWSTSRAATTARIAATSKRSGTGATRKEPALYDRLRRDLGVKDDPLAWSPAFARIAWRLHVPAAVPT